MNDPLLGTITQGQGLLETDAVKSPVKDIPWHTNEVVADSVKVEDPGAGKEVVIRHFFFKGMPIPKGQRRPTKPEIFSAYKRMMEQMLWMDALRPSEHMTANVIFKSELKKYPSLKAKFMVEGADFAILVPCEARVGASFSEKPFIAK